MRGPWRGIDAVEIATLEWVDWFYQRRLLGPMGSVPPAEKEFEDYKNLELAMAVRLRPRAPGIPGPVHSPEDGNGGQIVNGKRGIIMPPSRLSAPRC